MIKKVRSCFETNSSSAHSFSVSRKKKDILFPRVITFELGEFGSSTDEYMNEYVGRCNYLFTCAAYFDFLYEFKEMLKKVMPKEVNGFKTKIKFQKIKNNDDLWLCINHQSLDQAEEIITALLKDETLFVNFLFDDDTECNIVGDWVDVELNEFDEDGESRFVVK